MREFHSLAELALEFAEKAIAVHELDHQLLEHIAVSIEKRAKEKIGEYQAEAGPFEAWQELADATKEDRVTQGFSENEPLLRTGEMRDSIEHKVEGNEAHVGSNNDIAVYQELGTSTIPPRSFLGGAAVEKTPEILGLLGKTATAFLEGASVTKAISVIEHE